jgi:hypothetical protein
VIIIGIFGVGTCRWAGSKHLGDVGSAGEKATVATGRPTPTPTAEQLAGLVRKLLLDNVCRVTGVGEEEAVS